MQPQLSPSADGPKSTSTFDSDPPKATDGVQDSAEASTSGSPIVQQQHQEDQLLYNFRASTKQMHQLFGSTCHVKLRRCNVRSGLKAVSKVEDESDTGSSSSSDEDEVKVLPAPRAPSKQIGSPGVKKNEGKPVSHSHRKPDVCCTICRKTFRSKYYLKMHMQKHTGEKLYRCGICKRSFRNPRTVAVHKKMATQNGVCPSEKKQYGGWRPEGAWTCNICGKGMKHPNYYLDHMRIHRGEKLFKCGDCGKAWLTNSDLCKHRRVHTSIWFYVCVFCEKGFYERNSYWDHLRGHTEEKPFFCKVNGCGASFRQLGGLRSHRRLVHLKKD